MQYSLCIMRVAFLIYIKCFGYTGAYSYTLIDTFIELTDDDETLEIKIMKKYPSFGPIQHCDCNEVLDQDTKDKYLIVSNML